MLSRGEQFTYASLASWPNSGLLHSRRILYVWLSLLSFKDTPRWLPSSASKSGLIEAIETFRDTLPAFHGWEICSQLLSSLAFLKPCCVWSLTSMVFILVFTQQEENAPLFHLPWIKLPNYWTFLLCLEVFSFYMKNFLSKNKKISTYSKFKLCLKIWFMIKVLFQISHIIPSVYRY